MRKKTHFLNLYLTTTISIALVLLLIGAECVLIMGVRSGIERMKESVRLTIVLTQDADSATTARIEKMIAAAPFTKEYCYITKDEALADHIADMGEDPTLYLDYNPLSASFEVSLNNEYAQVDSIAAISKKFTVFTIVESVLYPQDIVEIIDSNINKYSIVILAIALVLLIVAMSLLSTTIRLQVYSKRFLINTMKLVGATGWSIKGPIVRRNILVGFIAALVALALLIGSLFYLRSSFGIFFFEMNWQNLLILSAIVIAIGVLITFLASVFATNRYIRMKTNDMYYV